MILEMEEKSETEKLNETKNGMSNGAFPSKTVIIGSAGRMGKRLLIEAENSNLHCVGMDIPYEVENCSQIFKDAELAILCVPAAALSDVIEKLRSYFPSKMILADITSVKEMPLKIMKKLWTGEVVGSHPLFGPNNDFETGLSVAIVPGRGGERSIQKVENFFKKLRCQVFRCSAKRHDMAMAKIQNMNFITNLAYFALLAEEEDLLPFLTPSFQRRKNAAQKMLTEDAPMFSGLFEANPYSHETVRQFGKMLNVAAGGDINLLCKRAQWWWENNKK